MVEQDANVTEPEEYPGFEETMAQLFGEGHEEESQVEPTDDDQPAAQEAEPDVLPDEPQEDGGSPPSIDKKGVQSAELERATHNLRFKLKAEQSELDSLTPEQIIAWWSRVAPVISENDRAYSERAELRRRTEELEAAKKVESADAVPATDEDFELPQALAEELGTDAANGLKQLVQTAMGRSQKVITSLESRVAAQEARTERTEAEVLYRELVEAGELGANPPEFSKVLPRAYNLSPAKGEWSEATGRDRGRALLLAAARLEGAGAVTADTERRTATASARRNGTATPSSQRSAPKRQLSEEEAIDAKIAAIERGVTDPAKLRQMYGH